MKKLIIAAFIFIGCKAPQHLSGVQIMRVTTVEKLKHGSVITVAGATGHYLVYSDTLKVNDEIPVSWVKPFKK